MALTDNLISYYKMDETSGTTADDAMENNDGTANHARVFTSEESGIINTCADFTQDDDYINTGITANIKAFSFWVKVTGTEDYWDAIITQASDSTHGFHLRRNDTNDNYQLKLDGTGHTLANISYEVATFQHIVITQDSEDTLVYCDGSLEHTISSDVWTTAGTLYLSSYGYQGIYSSSLIDEVGIWSDELTSTQVTELNNNQRTSNLNNLSFSKPLAWWQLGSNSSFNSGTWTALNEGTVSGGDAISTANMAEDDIVNGVGYTGNGLGTSTIDVKGDAPYSSANGLSENMDVLDRTTDVPS